MFANNENLIKFLASPVQATYKINDIFNTPRIAVFKESDASAIVGQMRGVASEFEELRTLLHGDSVVAVGQVFEDIVDALGDALVFCDGIPYRLNIQLDDIEPLYMALDSFVMGSHRFVDLSAAGVDVAGSFTAAFEQSLNDPFAAKFSRTDICSSNPIPHDSIRAGWMVHVSLVTWYKMRNLIVDTMSMMGVPVDKVINAILVSNESKLCATAQEAELSINDYVSRGMPEDALAVETNRDATAYIVRVIRDFTYIDSKGVKQDVFKGKFLKSIFFRNPDLSFLKGGE